MIRRRNIPRYSVAANKRRRLFDATGLALVLLHAVNCAPNQTAVVIAVDETEKGSVLPGAVTLRLDATLAGRPIDFSAPQLDIPFHDRGFTFGVAFPWPSDLPTDSTDPLLSVWATARDRQGCIIGVGCVLMALVHQGSVIGSPPDSALPPFCSGERIALRPIPRHCDDSPSLLMATPLELDQGWPGEPMPRQAPPLHLGGIGLPDRLHVTLADQLQSARPAGAQQWVIAQPSLLVLPPGPVKICIQDSDRRTLFCQEGPVQAALQQVATKHAWDPEPPAPPPALSDFLVLGKGLEPRLIVSTDEKNVTLAHAGVGAVQCPSQTLRPLLIGEYIAGERIRLASAPMDPIGAAGQVILRLRESGVSAFSLRNGYCLSDANFRELQITPPSTAKGRDLVALHRSNEKEKSLLFAIAQNTSVGLFALRPAGSADAYSFVPLDRISMPTDLGTPCALNAVDLDGDRQDDLATLFLHDDALWLHALLLADTGTVQNTVIDKVANSAAHECPTTAALTAADLDGDGCSDVVVNGLNAIFFNQSCVQGTSHGLRFVRKLLAPASPATWGGQTVQAVDLNADGLPDLIWKLGDSNLQYLLNTGRGVFTPPNPAFAIGPRRFPLFPASQPPRLALHDMNNDGMLDLVVGPVIELLLRRP